METVSSFPRLLGLVAALATVGCGTHYVTRGADLYAGGHYIEAAEVFERTEGRLTESSTEDRARYGLYRGATLLALGDVARAERWLNYTHEILRTDRSALSDDEQLMLARALQALIERTPTSPPPASGPAVATTRSLPVNTAALPEPTDRP